MNTKSMYTAIAFAGIVIAAGLIITSSKAQDPRDVRYRSDYRDNRGGFFGLGDRDNGYYRDGYYYNQRPSLIGSIVGGAARTVDAAVDTAGAAVDNTVNGPYDRRRYEEQRRYDAQRRYEDQQRYNREMMNRR